MISEDKLQPIKSHENFSSKALTVATTVYYRSTMITKKMKFSWLPKRVNFKSQLWADLAYQHPGSSHNKI
jgi:hypothetical protein